MFIEHVKATLRQQITNTIKKLHFVKQKTELDTKDSESTSEDNGTTKDRVDAPQHIIL